MPLTLAKLIANRAKAEIDFGEGDVLHVEYYPARITSKMLLEIADTDRLAELPNERALAVMSSATDTLLTLLASWDLADTAPDGTTETVLPIDRAHIEPLGLSIQWAILNGIVRAQAGEARAPEAQKADSANAPTSGAIS